MDIKDLKVEKAVKNFEIVNPYSDNRKFSIVKKNPLLSLFSNVFSESKESNPSMEKAKDKGDEKGKPSLAPLIALVLFMLLGVGAVFLFFVPKISTSVLDEAASSSSSPSFSISTYSLGDVGKNTSSIYFVADRSHSKDISLSVEMFRSPPISEVFVFSDVRDKAQTELLQEVVSDLSSELEKRGLKLSRVSFSNVRLIPPNSVLLVPTSRIPYEMLFSNHSHILSLANRGVHIIYVGETFDTYVDKDFSVRKTPSSVLNSLPFSFSESFSSAPSKRMRSAKYSIFSNSGNGIGYGFYVPIGNGSISFLPNTVDAGWKNPMDLALDISDIIFGKPLYSGTLDYVTIPSGDGKYSFSGPAVKRSDILYYRLYAQGVGPFSGFSERGPMGVLYAGNDGVILSSSVSGEEHLITYEPTYSVPKKTIYPYISFYKNGKLEKSIQLATNKISTKAEYQKGLSVDLNEGTYLAYLEDGEGGAFARSIVYSYPLEINTSFYPYLASFSFSVGGKPWTIESFEIIMDGKYSQKFSESDSAKLYPNAIIGSGRFPPGKHTFTVRIGGYEKSFVYDVPAPELPIFLQPPFLFTVVVSIGIVGVAVLFSKKDKKYYLFVPDFLPQEFQEIQLPESFILKLFDSINKKHKWKKMPLTVEEIRAELSKTLYKGAYLDATDYNVSSILRELVSSGKVVEYKGYFALSKWISKSITMKKLYLFRRLRDISVKYAVPYLQLGESKVADSEILLMGQRAFIYMFSEDLEWVKKLSAAIQSEEGMFILLVEDEDDLERVRSILNSPFRWSAFLKIMERNEKLSILDLSEFENLVKELS